VEQTVVERTKVLKGRVKRTLGKVHVGTNASCKLHRMDEWSREHTMSLATLTISACSIEYFGVVHACFMQKLRVDGDKKIQGRPSVKNRHGY